MMQKDKKALLSLSGGIDSATVLTWLLRNGYKVLCCSFLYGSKNNPHELQAVQKIYEYYKNNYPDGQIGYLSIDISSAFENVKSNLLKGQDPVPDGDYNNLSMRQKNIVPSRNIIFLSILSALAESNGADTVAIGIHKGDDIIYPDCRPPFFYAMKKAINLGTDGKVRAIAPFLLQNKAEIVKYGLKHGTPYHLTRSCYKEQEKACGKCEACVERLEAFRLNGAKDPIEYEIAIT